MAETLARMERDGVIDRQPHPADGRSMLLTLTSRSRQRFPKAEAGRWEAERDAMAVLSEEERELLRMLLKRVVEALEAQEAPGAPASARRSASSISPRTQARRR